VIKVAGSNLADGNDNIFFTNGRASAPQVTSTNWSEFYQQMQTSQLLLSDHTMYH